VAVEALARAVRPLVTVVLGGDGGDELLGGYDRYRALLLGGRLRKRTGRLIAALARSGSSLSALAGGSANRRGLTDRARRFLEALVSDPLERNEAWLSCFDEAEKRRLAGLPDEDGSSLAEHGRTARPVAPSEDGEEDAFEPLRSCYPAAGTPLE